MQFLVTGRDGTDDGALARRMAVREAHIAYTDEYVTSGNALYAVALLDDAGKMGGSVMIMEFGTREELDAWLAGEPYATNDVWESIDIEECRIGPSFSGKS
jgi:uncharacterized protein